MMDVLSSQLKNQLFQSQGPSAASNFNFGVPGATQDLLSEFTSLLSQNQRVPLANNGALSNVSPVDVLLATASLLVTTLVNPTLFQNLLSAPTATPTPTETPTTPSVKPDLKEITQKIRNGQDFFVKFDQSRNDRVYTGNSLTDPNGEFQFMETYKTSFKEGAFTTEGFNQTLNQSISSTHLPSRPLEDDEVCLWGIIYKLQIGPNGEVLFGNDKEGIVGHFSFEPLSQDLSVSSTPSSGMDQSTGIPAQRFQPPSVTPDEEEDTKKKKQQAA